MKLYASPDQFTIFTLCDVTNVKLKILLLKP